MNPGHSSSYSDRVAHIVGTYGLPLQAQVMDRLRDDLRASGSGRQDRFAEEEAAIYLARRLHALVMADLCACVGTGAIPGIREAWARFVQQAAYRVECGLINRVLFDHEILPLIEDLERIDPPTDLDPGATSAVSAARLSLSRPLAYHGDRSALPETGGDGHDCDVAGAAPGNADFRRDTGRHVEISPRACRGGER